MSLRDDVLAAVAGRRVSGRGWARGNCPVCELRLGRPDRKQCLGVHVPSGRWHCFRCSADGKIQDMPEEVAALAPRTEEVREVVRAMAPPEGFFRVTTGPGLTARSLADARRYLFNPPERGGRGLDPDVLHDAQVGACAVGRYHGRVVVPLISPSDGAWLGWSSRVWMGQKEWLARCEAAGVPRGEAEEHWRAYLYPPGMPRDWFYNHAALLVETDEPALVVEGVFDVLCDQVGPERGVAALGKPSHVQVEALIAARRPVVFLLDGDAWREAEALSLRLRFEGQRSGFVRLPPKTDPDQVTRRWVDDAAKDSLLAA
jgi:hypothetical protein